VTFHLTLPSVACSPCPCFTVGLRPRFGRHVGGEHSGAGEGRERNSCIVGRIEEPSEASGSSSYADAEDGDGVGEMNCLHVGSGFRNDQKMSEL
jgi:hypothetical protein